MFRYALNFAVRTAVMSVFAVTMVSLLGLPSSTPASVAAAPTSMPMPMPLVNADYRRFDFTIRTSVEDVTVTTSMGRSTHNLAKRADGLLGDISILNTYYQDATRHTDNMKHLASKAQSYSPSDKDSYAAYTRQCQQEASGFHDSLLGIESVLKQLGRDKGLANYDKNNQLETLLKQIVNGTKDGLTQIDLLVERIPVLGPVLGPVVYNVKCIIDDLLNASENILDGVLNGLSPSLLGLSSQAGKTACKSGLSIVGLCLLG